MKDTARLTGAPQHPSFRMDLKGRNDLELASLERPRSLLLVEQLEGPLEVVDLRSGTRLLATERGPRRLRFALPAGTYLIRRPAGARIFALETRLSDGQELQVDERQLEEVQVQRLDRKGVEEVLTPPAAWAVQLALGVRHAPVIDPGLRLANSGTGATVLFRMSYGLAKRWHLALPLALAYSPARSTGHQRTFWFGIPVIGAARGSAGKAVFSGLVGAGTDLRWFDVPGFDALNLTVSLLGTGQWRSSEDASLDTWAGVATLGGSWNLRGFVSLNLGGALAKSFVGAGQSEGLSELWAPNGTVWALGSVQRVGLRPLPLVGLHLTDSFSIEAHVTVAYVQDTSSIEETYLLGTAAVF